MLMSQFNDPSAIRAQIAMLQAQLSQVEPDEKPMLPAEATPAEILASIPSMEYVKTPPVITSEQIQSREQSILEGERLRNAVARGFDLSEAVTNGSFEVPELTH